MFLLCLWYIPSTAGLLPGSLSLFNRFIQGWGYIKTFFIWNALLFLFLEFSGTYLCSEPLEDRYYQENFFSGIIFHDILLEMAFLRRRECTARLLAKFSRIAETSLLLHLSSAHFSQSSLSHPEQWMCIARKFQVTLAFSSTLLFPLPNPVRMDAWRLLGSRPNRKGQARKPVVSSGRMPCRWPMRTYSRELWSSEMWK